MRTLRLRVGLSRFPEEPDCKPAVTAWLSALCLPCTIIPACLGFTLQIQGDGTQTAPTQQVCRGNHWRSAGLSAAAALGLGGPQQSSSTPSRTSHHSSIKQPLADPGARGEEEEGTLPKGKLSPWRSRPSPRRTCQPLPTPARPCTWAPPTTQLPRQPADLLILEGPPKHLRVLCLSAQTDHAYLTGDFSSHQTPLKHPSSSAKPSLRPTPHPTCSLLP